MNRPTNESQSPGGGGEISKIFCAAIDKLRQEEPQEAAVQRVVARALQISDACTPAASRPSRKTAGEPDSPANANRDTPKQQHREAVASGRPNSLVAPKRRKTLLRRLITLAATAAALAGVWLGVSISRSTISGPGDIAFGETLGHIQKAKTITWKQTFFSHMTSKDGKRTWVRTEKHEKAYKAPGLYRDTFFDESGQVWSLAITDSAHRKKLVMFPGTKQATLSEPVVLFADPSGPFEWAKKELDSTNLQWVESRKAAAGEVNVFRHTFREEASGEPRSVDFWIDRKTKQLVSVWSPGADIYDPDKDPARGNQAEKEYSDLRGPLGCVWHDIVVDANMDDSLFRLEPPAGYTVKIEPRGQVTEKETIDYLGVLAAFNDKTFPGQVFPFDVSNDRVNKAWAKPKKDRTVAEEKLIETEEYYIRKLHRTPLSLFVEDHAVKNSFRYLGKDVTLGDKGRIVCWYRLKDAKDPRMYRVVYGDLSVKNVVREDLPLPVDP